MVLLRTLFVDLGLEKKLGSGFRHAEFRFHSILRAKEGSGEIARREDREYWDFNEEEAAQVKLWIKEAYLE